jgi:hypothetical protein
MLTMDMNRRFLASCINYLRFKIIKVEVTFSTLPSSTMTLGSWRTGKKHRQ